jgi:hypothetical protein
MDNLLQRQGIEQEPHPSTHRGFADSSQDSIQTLVMKVIQNGDKDDPLIKKTWPNNAYPSSRSTELQWLHRLAITGG